MNSPKVFFTKKPFFFRKPFTDESETRGMLEQIVQGSQGPRGSKVKGHASGLDCCGNRAAATARGHGNPARISVICAATLINPY